VSINGDIGFGIIESLEGGEESIKAYIEELSQSSSIENVEVTYSSPEAYWTRVVHKMESDSIYETILKNECMTRLPVTIQGGIQYHVVLAPSNQLLKKLLGNLKSKFTSAKLVQIRSNPSSPFESILTAKQKAAFLLAFREGYYEMPRRIYITELAERLGIRRVAMQERLRRAEFRIMADFADGLI
jgi:predicted DNA binding protein